MSIIASASRKKHAYQLLQVGQDTEYFLRDRKTKTPVPVIGLVGGTKWNPNPVPELGNGFMVQEDNVMLEFNTPPAENRDEFVANMLKMRGYLKEMIGKKGFMIDVAPSMIFTPEQLAHPQAQEIGCEPDFNVWLRQRNESPKEHPLMQTARCAGGHIHVSFLVDGKAPSPDDIFVREPVVKALDVALKLPSLWLDKDKIRPQLYGRAGAFRPKDYGIEYRGLSNFWSKNERLLGWAYDGVVAGIDIATNQPNRLAEYATHIQQAVSEQDTNLAYELLRVFNVSGRVLKAA